MPAARGGSAAPTVDPLLVVVGGTSRRPHVTGDVIVAGDDLDLSPPD